MKKIIFLLSLIIAIGVYLAYTNVNKQYDILKKIKPSKDYAMTIEKIENRYDTSPETIELNKFETEKDINNWFIRYGEIELIRSPDYPIHGHPSMKIRFKGNTSGEIVLMYFYQFWNYFNNISLDIFNPNAEAFYLNFRIGDYFDNHTWYPDEKKFVRALLLEPGLNHYRFSIAEILKDIDIKSSKKSIHLNFKNTREGVLYITNLQLSRI